MSRKKFHGFVARVGPYLELPRFLHWLLSGHCGSNGNFDECPFIRNFQISTGWSMLSILVNFLSGRCALVIWHVFRAIIQISQADFSVAWDLIMRCQISPFLKILKFAIFRIYLICGLLVEISSSNKKLVSINYAPWNFEALWMKIDESQETCFIALLFSPHGSVQKF